MPNRAKVAGATLSAIFLLITPAAHGQTPDDRWQWNVTSNVFAGLNYQHRRLDDSKTFESQNWIMAIGQRPLGAGRVSAHAMVSLEPFTLKDPGSPQVFQTGETFNGAPLIDFQHPHDLFSTLSVAYSRPAGAWTWTASAAAVGSPALGPPPFMHRASAIENPQAPLAHHHLDSVHITPGVLTFAITRSEFTVDTSWFHGREPDETRTDIDLGPLDSWSLRGGWTRAAWSAQISGARINEPDVLSPGDMTRLMASISHTRTGPIATAVTAAWGHNREAHGNSNGVLVESTVSWLDRNHLYSRLELVGKELPHTHGGIPQSHAVMNVGGFTLGYTRDVITGTRGRIGIGGDATMYYVPLELQETYGAPLSFHFFLRYRFSSAANATAEHHH